MTDLFVQKIFDRGTFAAEERWAGAPITEWDAAREVEEVEEAAPMASAHHPQ